MIRVVHFIHGLNMGGAETLVKNYALLMDKSKFEVFVLCLNRENTPYEKALKEAGIPIVYLRDQLRLGNVKGPIAKFVNHYELYFEVRKALENLKPDVLHIHLELNKYVKFAHPRKNVCIFFTNHHTMERWKEDISDIRSMKWLMQNYSTKIIALTPKMQQEIEEFFKTRNVAVLNNGMELDLYKKKIDRYTKRRELGIPEDAFVVVHVGRFHPIKNHVFLIDIFAQIKKRKSNAFLVMVGRGETETEVRKKLQNDQVEDSAMILHDRTDVSEILQVADAAVFPSISEGLGISVLEMQAAGLPCVVSDGVPQGAKVSNKICFMSLEKSAETWAEKLLCLVENKDPIQYENLQEWDILHNVKQLEEMYEEAVKNG